MLFLEILIVKPLMFIRVPLFYLLVLFNLLYNIQQLHRGHIIKKLLKLFLSAHLMCFLKVLRCLPILFNILVLLLPSFCSLYDFALYSKGFVASVWNNSNKDKIYSPCHFCRNLIICFRVGKCVLCFIISRSSSWFVKFFWVLIFGNFAS